MQAHSGAVTSTASVALSVAKDFSRTPGPRKRSEGKWSGEEFLDLLRAKYLEARELRVPLVVNLDGAAGYPTSFLEAAFGGLARDRDKSPKQVLDTLVLLCREEPDLVDEIRQYIRDARA